jgi:predicted neuraminidase
MGGSNIRAIGRTKKGRIFAIDSRDDGKTWGVMRLLDVLNPDSGIDALRLADGRYLLAFNDSITGRTPLNVAISNDAEHWTLALTLESEPGEYSYPAVIQSRDGIVHITYTWRRQRIRHVEIDPTQLKG